SHTRGDTSGETRRCSGNYERSGYRERLVEAGDGSVHLSGVSLPSNGRHADQLPPAEIEPAGPGVRVRRPRTDAGGLSARRGAEVPVCFVRRLYAHNIKTGE